MLRRAEDVGMHLSSCSVCGLRQLRGPRAVHEITTPRGPALVSTCRGCGAELLVATSEVVARPALDGVA